MQELYQKVAADAGLRQKLAAILADAEKDGKEITGEKLEAFAKDAGYEVTMEEAQTFTGQTKAELSDDELDAVAGGKLDAYKIFSSVATFGIACAVASAGVASGGEDCGDYFQM